MKRYDGDKGGDPNDDVIDDANSKAVLFETTQGVIRTLIEELVEDRDRSFGLSWSNYYDSYLTIMAKSSTIEAHDRSFVHEKVPNEPGSITFTVRGGGHLELELEQGLVNGTLTGSNTAVFVDGVDVNATFQNSTISRFYGSHIELDIPPGPDKVHEVVTTGVHVVPEFPAASAVVLVLAIVAIITITTLAARRKDGFMAFFFGGR